MKQNPIHVQMRSMEGPNRKRISRVNAAVLMIDQIKPTILEGTAVRLDVATDGVDQGGSVTFLIDSKFFFTLYHAGKVNIILHVVSFSFLFYGLSVKSAPVVLIGLFIFDEMGTPTITSLRMTGALDSVSE